MRQTEGVTSRLTFLMIAEFVFTISFIQATAQPQQDKTGGEYDVRPKDFGLNGFFTSEFKRLPVYDFGLGKRYDLSENPEFSKEYEDYAYVGGTSDEDENDAEGDELMPELDLYQDDNMQRIDKRPSAYNFGLGKRQRYDFGLGKRGHRTYDFGLGKRSPATRNRMYNMGLGKRTRQYSFGLGKRPFVPGPMSSRFNFGLGKRSEEATSRVKIAKRDVQTKKTISKYEESTKDDETDGSNVDASSREVGRLAKRSSQLYSVDADDVDQRRPTDEFLRQFRNPLYNFGLGKRTYLSKSQKLKPSMD